MVELSKSYVDLILHISEFKNVCMTFGNILGLAEAVFRRLKTE